jgi:hypothetical protein
MISGRETLTSIDRALQEVKRQARELDVKIQGASAELIRLGQEESEQYKALAKLRVDQILGGELTSSLDATARQAGRLLAERERALTDLQRHIDALQTRQTELEAARATQARRVEDAAKALDEAEGTAQERLAQDATYQAQLERAQQVDRTAKHAEQKLELAEQDRGEKGKPYEADKLFRYLWRREYGTSHYRANPLIRYLDGKVAKLCGYHQARANYAILIEIPARLREHAQQVRNQADQEFDALQTLEQAATAASEVPATQAALAEEQRKLDTFDGQIEQVEQESQQLLAKRAAFAAGEDADFRKAVELMAVEFRRDSIVALRRAAQLTSTPEDDRIISRLAAIEEQKGRLEEALGHQQQALRGYQQRLSELESVRREFKRRRFDDMHSTFADGDLLALLLKEFLGGMLSREKLWRTIEHQQRRSPTRADPTFGTGGFDRGDSVWGRGGFGGGGFGGGGFRTGGDFGSGEGFRTGGKF